MHSEYHSFLLCIATAISWELSAQNNETQFLILSPNPHKQMLPKIIIMNLTYFLVSHPSREKLWLSIQILMLVLLLWSRNIVKGSTAHWHFSQKFCSPVFKISASMLLTLQIMVGWPLSSHNSIHLKTCSMIPGYLECSALS